MHAMSRMGADEFSQVKSGTTSSLETSSYVASQLVEEMSNAELVNTVENETRTNRQLFLENDVFERYLRRHEPAALANLEQMMQQAAQADARHNRISAAASRAGSLTQITSAMSVLGGGRRTAAGSARNSMSFLVNPFESRAVSASPSFMRVMTLKEGPSINLSHKLDMVTREMEELRTSFDQLTKVYTSSKAHLKAKIEEISTMVGEVQTTSEEFTDKVIVKGVEPLTKKIPARAWVRFLDEWFRKTDLLSGQLRLKTATYRALYKKLSEQLEEKIELGETLNPVDFEFQEIQRLEVTKELKRKNSDLSLLKTETATTHREFTLFKDHLAEQLAELQKLKTKTEEREKMIAVMEGDGERVQLDIEAAEGGLERILRFRKLYTVPEVFEYASVKDEIRRLRREMKNWTRRNGLQHKDLISTRQKFRRVKEALESL